MKKELSKKELANASGGISKEEFQIMRGHLKKHPIIMDANYERRLDIKLEEKRTIDIKRVTSKTLIRRRVAIK